jgi:HK97 family phage prohead protease
MTIHKTFAAELVSKSDAGGRITISTASLDRDNDRVMPSGVILDNYTRNPVVMWGHSYGAPADLIGRAVNLEVSDSGITADFELRPAANDQDPQNIVRLLWDGGWVRTASIGFRPIAAQANEFGGKDFTAWELLEFSLTPVPANADALRLAAKALDAFAGVEPGGEGIAPDEPEAPPAPEAKADEPAVTDANDSEGAPPHTAPDADAIDADQEQQLTALLSDFVNAVRPLLGNGD